MCYSLIHFVLKGTTINIQDNSSDSDGPISRGARRLAVAYSQRNSNDGVPLTKSEPCKRLPLTVGHPHHKRQHAPSNSRRDGIQEEPATSAPGADPATLAPPMNGRTALHSYFAQFAGHRNSVVTVEPVAPADADMLDLRRAVPEVSMPLQYLPPQYRALEAVHVPGPQDVSSGNTSSGSDSDSHSSFVDDTPTKLSKRDIAFVTVHEKTLARALPLTAACLGLEPADLSALQHPASPATVAVHKRRRYIVTSSSSSSPS